MQKLLAKQNHEGGECDVPERYSCSLNNKKATLSIRKKGLIPLLLNSIFLLGLLLVSILKQVVHYFIMITMTFDMINMNKDN